MKEANLPSWAESLGAGRVEIDAEQFYPEILDELWANAEWPEEVQNTIYDGLQRTEVDQYWLEVAYQVAKMDIQSAVSGTDLMPEKGGALVIIIKDNSKETDSSGTSKYAQRDKPKGRGADMASTGKEAREHYKRIRAVLI